MKPQELRKMLQDVGKLSLGLLPTPLQEMPNAAREMGAATAYVKRDDLTGLGPGGNKVRNLEYILGDAARMGADTVIVSGPAQSNLCAIAACACAKTGLGCVLVLNGQENPAMTGNLLLDRLTGAEVIYLGPVKKEERNAYMQKVKADLEAAGKRPYVIENGASTGYGAIGYMDALLELDMQNNSLKNKVKSIFIPAGNGGVAAGLVFANDLIGRPFQIVPVSTEFTKPELTGKMRSIIAEAEEILGVPFASDMEDACHITDEYYGGGWGIDTKESRKAVEQFAKLEGFYIENIYTAKTFVGMCDCVKKGIVDKEGVCFWHTGGFASLFAQY